MSTQFLRHHFAGLLWLVVFAAAGAALLVAWRSYRSMHRLLEAGAPSAPLANSGPIGVANIAKVSFVSRDGLRLVGWYVPPLGGASVIVTHGATGDRGTMLAEVRLLAKAGIGVLAFDWPGLGESEGLVRWDGQARGALVAAIDWLAARAEVDAGRIGALGFSMGGVMVAQVAAEDERIRAVVLEAPAADFRDYVRVNSRNGGAWTEWAGRLALRGSGLLDAGSDSTAAIWRIAPRPVLIVGGGNDAAVPRASLDKLYGAARDPRSLWIIDGAGHGNYHAAAPGPYAATLADFFGRNLASR
jgi:uncharacterized protein